MFVWLWHLLGVSFGLSLGVLVGLAIGPFLFPALFPPKDYNFLDESADNDDNVEV